jgi:hypothetical protein
MPNWRRREIFNWHHHSKLLKINLQYTKLQLYIGHTLTSREAHNLRVFENRALRKTFGPKREEVTVEWRKLHTEKLHKLWTYSDEMKENELDGECSTRGRYEKTYTKFWT